MNKRVKNFLFVGFLALLVIVSTLLFVARSEYYDDGLKINEIAFSMDSGIDWIEIYNPSLRNVSLRGMYLSDDNGDLMRFEIEESLVLGPGDYLLVYCNEYEGDLTGTTMTSFRISQSETVYLVDIDGATVVDSLVAVLGNDVADVTVGRYPDGSDDIYMMADYTPGEANQRGESLEDIYSAGEINYEALFNFDEIHEIRFTITEEDTVVMESYANGQERIDPTYVPSVMEFDGVLYEEIAVRYKGNSSLYSNQSLKKSLRIDMNYYADLDLMGIQEFVLNCNFKDPSELRETLGYYLFNQIGAAASLTAFAEVYVNDEYLGLYTMIENLDDEYLERNFGDSDGYLFKVAQNGFTFEYLGDNVDDYADYIELKRGDETLGWYVLFDFLQILNEEVDDSYEEEILEVFDVYGFLDQMALTVLSSHMDSYLVSGRNMGIYYDPTDSLWKTLPWDLNEVFGSYMGYEANLEWDVYDPISAVTETGMSSEEGRMPMSPGLFKQKPPLDGMEGMMPPPGGGEGGMEGGGEGMMMLNDDRPLFTQLMEVPEFREYYYEQVRFYVYEVFTSENLDPLIDDLFDLINSSVAAQNDDAGMFTYEQFVQSISEDVEGSSAGPGGSNVFHGIKSFITTRSKIVKNQLSS